MEYIEGFKRSQIVNSQEPLTTPPLDPRAWHCKTVEEYRLCRFSSNYQDQLESSHELDFLDQLDSLEIEN